ncbi:tyrosine-type recombinase/integrase [Agrobacterium vitis]|uniref:tyrosine-type recombinase/integrase n=1 Tax=Agrobacterium vitis TaxID=373 RepID=UPI0012E808AF|nr:tyrosine-type recombinase/integrase [Agrobacterium vitis]MCF1479404.1 tyrosine-type recombinase/integrase [Agrobacterium vitis]MVA28748.1 tyrosine-type recombinase/integrase [Agrobacterium vitis]
MEDMPRPRYQYVQKQTTRHNKTVWYFRIGDGKRTRLPGEYASEEFIAAWKSLMAGAQVEKSAPSKHTLQWLVDKYQESAAFKGLKESTQANRRNILKVACKTGGKMIVSHIDRAAIAAGRDRRAATPHAAVNYMKVMGYLFEWAVDAGYARENPVRGVKRPRPKSRGFLPWSEQDVIDFYRHHGPGTPARLAMEMMLFTGLRRQDVYRLGPQHIKDGVIEIRAGKNDAELFIPLHPILAQTLSRTSTGHLAYLVTPVHGRPFKSAAAFGNWFGDMCREAGIDGRAHGLRKSIAQKLAEAGGSNAELKALFGWNSDAMAALYTKKADRKKLSQAAATKLNGNILSPHPKPSTPHLKNS